MHARNVWRSLLILTALPAGWTVGYLAVWRIGSAALAYQGEAWENLRALVLSSIAGGGLGAALAAGCAWHFTRPVTK